MIKVIKHGKKKFKAICANCGCEFTYELDDMRPLGCTNCVDCPDCGQYIPHVVMRPTEGKNDEQEVPYDYRLDS